MALRELTSRPLADGAEWRSAARDIVRDGRTRMVARTLRERGTPPICADRALQVPA